MTSPAAPLATLPVGKIEPPPLKDRWLVRSLWPATAVGMLFGAPKSFKTWLGLDLALSVASASPCLGRFAVEQPGPVLAYLAEDSLARARQRIEGMARHRQIDLMKLELHLITEPVLRLDLERDLDRLFATVKKLQPRLLLLDPFVRIHRINENDAGEVSTVLNGLRQLQRAHDLAIVVVHHARKNGRHVSGEALRGSGDLYAWGDTYAHLKRHEKVLRLTLEHRDERPIEPVNLKLVNNDDGSCSRLQLATTDEANAIDESSLEEELIAALTQAAEPMTRTALRARLRVNNQRLGLVLAALADDQRIEHSAEGWTITHRSRNERP